MSCIECFTKLGVTFYEIIIALKFNECENEVVS